LNDGESGTPDQVRGDETGNYTFQIQTEPPPAGAMMSGPMTAAFVLGINMAVAGIFAVAFAVLAVMNRSARGAWWLALGCGMGLVNIGLEFLLRQQTDPVPVSIGIFLVYLSALSFV